MHIIYIFWNRSIDHTTISIQTSSPSCLSELLNPFPGKVERKNITFNKYQYNSYATVHECLFITLLADWFILCCCCW